MDAQGRATDVPRGTRGRTSHVRFRAVKSSSSAASRSRGPARRGREPDAVLACHRPPRPSTRPNGRPPQPVPRPDRVACLHDGPLREAGCSLVVPRGTHVARAVAGVPRGTRDGPATGSETSCSTWNDLGRSRVTAPVGGRSSTWNPRRATPIGGSARSAARAALGSAAAAGPRPAAYAAAGCAAGYPRRRSRRSSCRPAQVRARAAPSEASARAHIGAAFGRGSPHGDTRTILRILRRRDRSERPRSDGAALEPPASDHRARQLVLPTGNGLAWIVHRGCTQAPPTDASVVSMTYDRHHRRVVGLPPVWCPDQPTSHGRCRLTVRRARRGLCASALRRGRAGSRSSTCHGGGSLPEPRWRGHGAPTHTDAGAASGRRALSGQAVVGRVPRSPMSRVRAPEGI